MFFLLYTHATSFILHSSYIFLIVNSYCTIFLIYFILGLLMDHKKSMLTLIFPNQKAALSWRKIIEERIIHNDSDSFSNRIVNNNNNQNSGNNNNSDNNNNNNNNNNNDNNDNDGDGRYYHNDKDSDNDNESNSNIDNNNSENKRDNKSVINNNHNDNDSDSDDNDNNRNVNKSIDTSTESKDNQNNGNPTKTVVNSQRNSAEQYCFNSILIVPTAGLSHTQTELLKIEIARTISSAVRS